MHSVWPILSRNRPNQHQQEVDSRLPAGRSYLPDENAVGGEKEGRRFKDAGDRPVRREVACHGGRTLQGMLDAYEQVVHRTTVTAILTP